MPRGRRIAHNRSHKPHVARVNHHKPHAVHVNHHKPVVVNRGPVVVRRPPPVGMGLATGMMMGMATGLMIGSMSRRRNAAKVKESSITIIQPFPGTLVVVHDKHTHNAEFYTIPPGQDIPPECAIVLQYQQVGTPVQIREQEHHFHYKVIPPGEHLPKGNNVKIIKVKLAPGTLVQAKTEDGVPVQIIIPPGQQIPPGSVVLRRPDGIPPPGTVIEIKQADGNIIQQVIPDGQKIPDGAKIIDTGRGIPSNMQEKKVTSYPQPPSNVSVDDNKSTNYPPPPTTVNLDDKNNNTREVPTYAQFSNDSTMNEEKKEEVPSYAQISNDKTANIETLKKSQIPPYAQNSSNNNDSSLNRPVSAAPDYYKPYAPLQQPSQPTNVPQQQRPASTNIGKEKPPIWVPDSSSELCTSCKSPFSFTNRRHHCRNCGKLFCHECCGNMISIPRYSIYTPERVCNTCYESITGKQAPPPQSGGLCIIS